MEWKQGLFGCFDNIALSCYTCCLFQFAVGKNAESVGESNAVLWAIAVSTAPCIVGMLLRRLIREKKGIPGDAFSDGLMWQCCPCLAIIQETAETGSLDYLLKPVVQDMERGQPAQAQQEPQQAQ